MMKDYQVNIGVYFLLGIPTDESKANFSNKVMVKLAKQQHTCVILTQVTFICRIQVLSFHHHLLSEEIKEMKL